jgi:hypothetical protein
VDLRCGGAVAALADAVIAVEDKLSQFLPFVARQIFVVMVPPLCIFLGLLPLPPVPFFTKFLALLFPFFYLLIREYLDQPRASPVAPERDVDCRRHTQSNRNIGNVIAALTLPACQPGPKPRSGQCARNRSFTADPFGALWPAAGRWTRSAAAGRLKRCGLVCSCVCRAVFDL